MWPRSYVEWLRGAGAESLRQQADAMFERVKFDFGDIKDLNGTVLQEETLADMADRELIDSRYAAYRTNGSRRSQEKTSTASG